MATNTLLKRMLDAGMQFTEMSQDTAERLVKDFVKSGQVRRKDSEKTVQQLVDRGRSATEHVVATVQAEISKQLGRFADRLDGVEERVEELAQRLGLKAKKAAAPAKKAAKKAAAPAKKAAKKAAAPAKKAAKKAAAPAKKAAKKAAAATTA